jgi:hypothetical protein
LRCVVESELHGWGGLNQVCQDPVIPLLLLLRGQNF